MDFDSAVLERVAQRFRRDMWESVVPEAVTESGIEVASFGPVQATAFGDLPEAHSLNQIQGAAEPGAMEGGHLAEAVEWMRAREVDYRVPVAEARPGAAEAELARRRGYERGGGWIKLVRDAAPRTCPRTLGSRSMSSARTKRTAKGSARSSRKRLDLPVTAGTLFFSLPQKEHWRCYTAALGARRGRWSRPPR